MSTAAPALAPIFRSDTQLQILGLTYLTPERRFTMPELVRGSRHPQPTVAREVARLVDAGLLESDLHGGRRLVQAATTSPIFTELQSILLKTLGPKSVLETVLRSVDGVDRALIYGSWAQRYQGRAGALPQDVDLMIIGTASVDVVRNAADDASRRLGRDVNATVLRPDEWERSGTGFIAQLKSAPFVELDLTR